MIKFQNINYHYNFKKLLYYNSPLPITSVYVSTYSWMKWLYIRKEPGSFIQFRGRAQPTLRS